MKKKPQEEMKTMNGKAKKNTQETRVRQKYGSHASFTMIVCVGYVSHANMFSLSGLQWFTIYKLCVCVLTRMFYHHHFFPILNNFSPYSS